MKVRENRKRVAIKARMRTDKGWEDVVIRNLSSRGIGLRAPVAPVRGNYVEIYRLDQHLIGRVAWSNGADFGIFLREPVSVDDVVAGCAKQLAGRNGDGTERRRFSRETRHQFITLDERTQQSQFLSKMISFVSIILITVMAGFVLYDLASTTLSTPLKSVSARLERAS